MAFANSGSCGADRDTLLENQRKCSEPSFEPLSSFLGDDAARPKAPVVKLINTCKYQRDNQVIGDPTIYRSLVRNVDNDPGLRDRITPLCVTRGVSIF